MGILIVVPFIDNLGVTMDCLKSVQDTKSDADSVVAIANGAKDGIYDKIFDTFDNGTDFSVIRTGKQSRWVGELWNRAFRLMVMDEGYEQVCFLHNDTVVRGNWLTELSLALDVFHDGCILPRQGNGTRGARFTVVDDVEQVNGFCFLLPRSVIERTGTFNNRFVLKPDMDYFHRILGNGMNLIVANNAVVEHIGGVTTGKRYSLSYYTEQVSKEISAIRNR